MSVEEAREWYLLGAAIMRPDASGRFCLKVDAAGIALDTATARAISGSDTPGAGPTWSQRWRTRQSAIWADREHKALMAEVAW